MSFINIKKLDNLITIKESDDDMSAIKSEIYPITLQIELDSSINLSDSESLSINLESSEIKIYNDRGGDITYTSPTTGDKSNLFVDNSNLLIGYLWDTNNSRFNVQDYYLFKFLVAIDYKISDEVTKTFKLSHSTKLFLEANSTL